MATTGRPSGRPNLAGGPDDPGGATATLVGDRVGGTGQHEDETEAAEHDSEHARVLGHAHDKQDQADDDASGTEQQPPPGPCASGRTAHGRGELRVLGVERTLHLFKQALLVLGERHVDLLQVHTA